MNTQETAKCEKCLEIFEEKYLVAYTQYNQIEYNLCVFCYDKSQEKYAKYKEKEDLKTKQIADKKAEKAAKAKQKYHSKEEREKRELIKLEKLIVKSFIKGLRKIKK